MKLPDAGKKISDRISDINEVKLQCNAASFCESLLKDRSQPVCRCDFIARKHSRGNGINQIDQLLLNLRFRD